MIDLPTVIVEVADALAAVDATRTPFKAFQPGVGPYAEPQLVRLVVQRLNSSPFLQGLVSTRRKPDLLIKDHWALEVKLVRPFGDNGREAENWSVNLLHPYAGNVSALSDCLKLLSLESPERKAVVVVGYEHDPPQISLKPLIDSFELIAERILSIELGPRVMEVRKPLVHAVHQQLTVFAWEVLGRGQPG
jgi:hypothetical protein